jgi:hypothetical protein
MINFLKKRPNLFFLSTFTKFRVKLVFVVVAFIILGISVLYIKHLENDLKEREINTLNLYVGKYKLFTSPNVSISDFYNYLQKVDSAVFFPVINTDNNDNPLVYQGSTIDKSPFRGSTLNIVIDSNKPVE